MHDSVFASHAKRASAFAFSNRDEYTVVGPQGVYQLGRRRTGPIEKFACEANPDDQMIDASGNFLERPFGTTFQVGDDRHTHVACRFHNRQRFIRTVVIDQDTSGGSDLIPGRMAENRSQPRAGVRQYRTIARRRVDQNRRVCRRVFRRPRVFIDFDAEFAKAFRHESRGIVRPQPPAVATSCAPGGGRKKGSPRQSTTPTNNPRHTPFFVRAREPIHVQYVIDRYGADSQHVPTYRHKFPPIAAIDSIDGTISTTLHELQRPPSTRPSQVPLPATGR